MSRIESFTRMFDKESANGDVITRVEIPLIQRDYAQGRRGEKVDEIRRNFLSVLHGALVGENPHPVGLDFVYGERKPDGTLQPLDGQQRLTTLFVLHWYLAARSGNLTSATGWTNFSYETRPSARRFCQRLITVIPPTEVSNLSRWIQDQPWCLFVWRYDPTINSMLVMIDAIDEQFGDVDAQQAWERLTSVDNPAVSFHLLPLPDMGSAEDLYVKMNSRGKPLTEFENFKARFEKILEWSPCATDFAHKADTIWSDILWSFRGDDDLIDDEFLRYFDFITEVCEWTSDELGSGADASRIQRATHVFGADSPRREEHLDFLFRAFDVWGDRDVAASFEGLFHTSAASASAGDDSLPLFFRDPNINLFESCCRAYGETTGNTRSFTFGQTLLLLAVVLHLDGSTEDFARRLRTLRNLIEGSQFEMRAERMPRLVADTRALILDGVLPQSGGTFAVAQIADETEKRAFIAEHPEAETALRALEDNFLLKGSVTAFALDSSTLAIRGSTFNTLMADPNLWWDLTGALLTIGEYQRPRDRTNQLLDSDSFQFGTWDGKYSDAWRSTFTGRTRADLAVTASVLAGLLDRLAETSAPISQTLTDMQNEWLQQRESEQIFDWRYYLVKYRSARAGGSGIYFAQGKRMGFSLANLPGGKERQSANYDDPYLLSIYNKMGMPAAVLSQWYTGYVSDPRWLRLKTSGVGLRSVPNGLQLLRPADEEFHTAFDAVADELGVVAVGSVLSALIVNVAKATEDEAGPDAENRIELGVRILRRLIEAGL